MSCPSRLGPFVAAALFLCCTANAKAAGPFSFYTVTPCRIVDTRGPAGPTGGPNLVAGQPRSFPIRQYCGIPSTAMAAALNVTVTQSTAEGHLTIWPYNTPQPLVSSINFVAGEPALANGAIVPLASDPGLQVSVVSAANVHVIIDVTGYFEGPAGNFFTVTPCRLLDTRPGNNPITGTPRTVSVTGNCGIPAGAIAAVGNLTAITPAATGYINLYPTGPSPPTATLNYRAGVTRANNFVMPLSSVGQVNLFASSTVHALIDLFGYFVSATPAVWVGASTVEAGSTISVTWTGISAPTSTDWVGLYPIGIPDTSYGFWLYTNGAPSGSMPFPIDLSVTAGTYEMRLFRNDTFVRLATSAPFTVTRPTTCPAANPTDSNPDDGALQACLNAGGTVRLDPFGSGYLVATGIQITQNGTILTSGVPGQRARLQAAPALAAPILSVLNKDNVTISWIEFDGNRPNRTRISEACMPGGFPGANINAGSEFADPLNPPEVRNFTFMNNRSTRTPCGTGLGIIGRGFEIANNVFDDLGIGRGDEPVSRVSDGITLARCINGYVHHNTITDATDIGIVSGGGQGCRIEYNVIQNVSRHAEAGIALHAFCFPEACGVNTNGVVKGNVLTSGFDLMRFGISIGLHPWGFPPDTRVTGGSVTDNNVSGAKVNLAIDGVGCLQGEASCPSASLPGITVMNNTLGTAQGNLVCSSPPTPAAYTVNSAHVKLSTLQGGWQERAFDTCIP